MLADLILHVVDASEPGPSRAAAMRAVDDVLEEIGAGDAPRLIVFNKLDLLDEEDRRDLLVGHRDAVGVSAPRGRGDRRASRRGRPTSSRRRCAPMELLFPYDDGAQPQRAARVAGQVEREDRDDGVLVRARVPRALAHRFEDYSVNGAALAVRDGAARSALLVPGARAADPRPPGRRRPRPARRRAGRDRARGAGGGRHRDRGRDPAPVTPASSCRAPGSRCRHGIALVNAPGLIDSGYRGEIRVLLLNTDRERDFEIEPGDRIAQLLVVPFAAVEPVEAAELERERARRAAASARAGLVRSSRARRPTWRPACAASSSASSSGARSGRVPVAALDRAGDQLVRQPGVLGQQRAVQVGADQVPATTPSSPSRAVVAVAVRARGRAAVAAEPR